ncbi:MAG: hypothetical protein A2W08_15505 [Candidatus Rokubacteria bacterium RBG_16_73_20]|nr:MAG: hypothetical protein A2W08_15505 [Candidatus Rokubacteria bacterium RBG_16_73_20]
MSGRITCASAVVSSGSVAKLTTSPTFRAASAKRSPPGSAWTGFTPGPSSSTSTSPCSMARTSRATSA